MLAIIRCPNCNARVIPKEGKCPSCQTVLPTAVTVEESRPAPPLSAPPPTTPDAPPQPRTIPAPRPTRTTTLQCIWMGKGRGLTPLPWFLIGLGVLLQIGAKIAWRTERGTIGYDLAILSVNLPLLFFLIRALIRNRGLRTVVSVTSNADELVRLTVHRGSMQEELPGSFRILRGGSTPSAEGVVLTVTLRSVAGAPPLVLQERRLDLSALPEGWAEADVPEAPDRTYETEDLMWFSEQLPDHGKP